MFEGLFYVTKATSTYFILWNYTEANENFAMYARRDFFHINYFHFFEKITVYSYALTELLCDQYYKKLWLPRNFYKKILCIVFSYLLSLIME